jgi:hypothetical protein
MKYLVTVLMVSFMFLVTTPLFAQQVKKSTGTAQSPAPAFHPPAAPTMKSVDHTVVPSPGQPHFQTRQANDPVVTPHVQPSDGRTTVNPYVPHDASGPGPHN